MGHNMALRTTSLNTNISVDEKEEFKRNTEALGLTPSAAIKIFVHMFNECGGFPFELRRRVVQNTTYVSEPDFEAFSKALEQPMPTEAIELLNRDFSWEK